MTSIVTPLIQLALTLKHHYHFVCSPGAQVFDREPFHNL